MTRKEFLQVVGIAIISVFGVSNFFSSLMQHSEKTSRSTDIAEVPTIHGFGSRKFGD